MFLSKILSIKFQTGKTNDKKYNMKTLVNYQNGFVLITLWIFYVTFNNISVISWRSVLLVEENGENNGHVAIYWQTYHIMLYRVHLAMQYGLCQWEIFKNMYHEKFNQNKFNRELHVYYQYGSSQSFQWGNHYLLIACFWSKYYR
jgi:hypothetical protein